MLSLYEILKASKTNIAPDMWTALAGMNWGGADSGHEVKELTGIPPLSFTADGTPLLDYLISGNMSQSGTPTPDNPIQPQETGERTWNLFDKSTAVVGYGVDNNSGSLFRSAALSASDYINISGESYIRATYITSGVANQYGAFYDENKTYISGYSGYSNAIAVPQNAVYTKITARTEYIDEFMLNLGSEALPYENFGYKIPITSAGQTNNIYLGEVETTRKIKKLVLTGEESGAVTVDSTNHIFALRGIFNSGPGLLQVGGICTHYKYNNAVSSLASNMQNGDFVLNRIVNDYSFTIKDNSFNTASDFKAYLAAQYAAGTPVTIWYVLATPETAVVNEPLRKIGDYADTVSYEQAGVQIPTLHGNTIIDVLTELKPSEMYIKYKG